MASLNRESNGNYTVQVVCGDGKRRSIRLGKVNKKTATEIKTRVEHLNALLVARLPMDADTARWVGGIGDELAKKLAAAGLIPPRHSAKLGDFLSAYMARRKADAKGSTLTNLNTISNDLLGFFGAGADVRSVTEGQADAFRVHLLTRTPKLAAATVARRLRTVRMIFKNAVRLKATDANSFAEVTARSAAPEERKAYIPAADAERLTSQSDPTWRLIVALCRYAGLRCPSEVLSLKWEQVNFETARMTVPSCKTEHIPGKAYRVVPIFARLRPYLDEAFDLAADGAVYVVPGDHRDAANQPGGWVNCNLRTHFLRLIRRAGLQPWPRLFHNLRASCETDLLATYPIHVVCSWIGNTPAVALKHYAQVLDSDFATAAGAETGAVVVQNPVQSGAAREGQEETVPRFSLENEGFCPSLSSTGVHRPLEEMGLLGFERGSTSTYAVETLRKLLVSAGAESGAVADPAAFVASLTPDQRAALASLLSPSPVPNTTTADPAETSPESPASLRTRAAKPGRRPRAGG